MGRLSWRMPLIISSALLIGSLGAVPGAVSGAQLTTRRADAIPGRYIVLLEGGSSGLDRAPAGAAWHASRLGAAHGFKASRVFATLNGFAASLSPAQAAALRADRSVDAVVPDRPMRATDTPLQSGDATPTGVRRIEAGTASVVQGASSVRVAVVDTGVDLNHPDLSVVSGVNCVTPGASADDDNGHGTHVAGTIGARNNGVGLTGVAPGTSIVSVKVLDAAGEGSWSSIVCGIDWLTALRRDADPTNDVSVVNMSLGGSGPTVEPCATTTDALHRAVCTATAAGMTFVVAAGNHGWDFDYAPAPDLPAAYPEVLTVSAITDSDGRSGGAGGSPACSTGETDDQYASYSNFAATAAGAAHVVAAPGTCIRSTWPGGGYRTISGTSMAAPHAAGAVALCIGESGSAGPCAGLAPAEIITRVRADAASHRTADPAYGFAGDPSGPAGGRYYGDLVHVGVGSPSTEPETETTVEIAPSAAVITKGSLRAGSYARLAANDNRYYEVNSTARAKYTSAWYGRVTGLSRTASALAVAYRGLNSRSCAQTVALWNWAARRWVVLDSRTVGTSEVAVERAATGATSELISATSGEVRVRVRCQTSAGAFVARADQLSLLVTGQ